MMEGIFKLISLITIGYPTILIIFPHIVPRPFMQALMALFAMILLVNSLVEQEVGSYAKEYKVGEDKVSANDTGGITFFTWKPSRVGFIALFLATVPIPMEGFLSSMTFAWSIALFTAGALTIEVSVDELGDLFGWMIVGGGIAKAYSGILPWVIFASGIVGYLIYWRIEVVKHAKRKKVQKQQRAKQQTKS